MKEINVQNQTRLDRKSKGYTNKVPEQRCHGKFRNYPLDPESGSFE